MQERLDGARPAISITAMPIFQNARKLLYFAHVPKCAGTSIENYLTRRFGPAALLDRRFVPGRQRNWTSTSPQHVPAAQLERLFPEGFFDAGFAFVRDPLARATSAFHFHQSNRGKIDADLSLADWIRRIPGFKPDMHDRYDGHFRSQSHIVPQWCRVFRLEDGFDEFIAWLDAWSASTHGAGMAHTLAGRYEAGSLDKVTLGLFHNLYRDDYDRFGYDI